MRRLAFLCVGVLASLALLVEAGSDIVTDPPVAEADIGTTDIGAMHDRDKVLGWAAIARNVVLGRSIAVCTTDYPVTTGSAVEMWNEHLQATAPMGYLTTTTGRSRFMATDAFAAPTSSCPDAAALSTEDYVSYVKVVARHPDTSPDFYCSATANGCVVLPPRSNDPLHTFFGKVTVIMNEVQRPPAGDATGHRSLERTIAHELGHVLGIDHPPGGDKAKGACTVTALMTTRCPAHYPLSQNDLDRYAAAYRPNLVKKRRFAREVPFAQERRGKPGTVVFSFDARDVKVEKNIEIRVWNESESRWELLKTFGPGTGEVTWELVGQAEEEATTKTYGIFSTTEAYLEKQCVIDDKECDAIASVAAPASKERIGFGEPIPDVPISARPVEPPTTYSLEVPARRGSGDTAEAELGDRVLQMVGEELSTSPYPAGTSVELTAEPETVRLDHKHPDNASGRAMDKAVSEFVRWEGANAGDCVTSGSEGQICTLTMDGDKALVARFRWLTYDVTTKWTTIASDGTSRTETEDAIDNTYIDPMEPEPLNAGTTWRLEAAWVDSLHKFGGWEGECKASVDKDDLGYCDVRDIHGDRTVTAAFWERPPLSGLSLTGLPARAFTFEEDTTQYEVVVGENLGRTTVTATPEDASWTVGITPTDDDDTTDAHEVDLAPRATTEIKVTVTGTITGTVEYTTGSMAKSEMLSRVYTLDVIRPDLRLKSLSLSGGTLSPAFDAATTSYTTRVGAGVSRVTVVATAEDADNVAVSVSPDADPSTPQGEVDLTPGATTTVTVTVSRGLVSRSYTAAVTRDPYQCTVTVGPNANNFGRVSAVEGDTGTPPSQSGTQSETVDCGQEVALTAAPFPGYVFVNWTVPSATTGVSFDRCDTDPAACVVTTNAGATSDETVSVTANFGADLVTYLLKWSSMETGGSADCVLQGTTTTCPATVEAGTRVKLTARADDGYAFRHWVVTTEEDDGAQGAAEQTRTQNPLDIPVNADTTVIPVFRVDTVPEFPDDADPFTAPFTVSVAGSVSLPRASGGDGTLSYTPSHRSRRGSR